MSKIIIIAAIAKNKIIGNNGDIPWRIKEDFLHFKTITTGHPCIMGRKTYESLPTKPLPGRENIIVTRDKDYKADGAKIFNSFDAALKYTSNNEKVYICGGAEIYKLAMQFADSLELTKINLSPKGDTYFPNIDYNEWDLINEEKHESYTFLTYKRKK